MVGVENVTEQTLYDDLKGFLQSDRDDLRQAAADAIQQVHDPHDMAQIVQHGIVPHLARLGATSVTALQALVQLSSHGTSANQCVVDLMEAGGLNRMLELLLTTEKTKSWKPQVNYAMALLANITRTEQGAVELVGLQFPEAAVSKDQVESAEKLPTKPSLELLLHRFLTDSFIEPTDYTELEGEALDIDSSDPYQHFAAVLMNSTQVEAGRQFCMKIHRSDPNDVGWTVFQKILSQLKSPNPLRRRGIAGVIRNCCLDRDAAWWIMNEAKITTPLLYPLAGPEELDLDEKKGLDPDLWLAGPDKVREVDATTRLYLVESILLLCASGRTSRTHLRLQRVYVILKWADMVEEDEIVSERIDECVQFLRRDEEGTSDGSSDRFVYETYHNPTTTQVGASDDFDQVD